MTPAAFVAKWKDNPLSEKAGAQSYFLDLCDLLSVDKPDDPNNYCFERGATKTGSGNGWADVWKRNCFAWENKGPDGDLGKALKQLMTYALALDNPPLLVVCNRALIEIHTHFTGTPSEVHTIALEDIGSPDNLQKLRWLFTEPERFKPKRTVHDITAAAAGRFAEVAYSVTKRGHDPQAVAHFLIQCLFCMFAEDVRLLPQRLFGKIVEKSAGDGDKLAARLGELFERMRKGGEFLLEDIQWFNGGLFETIAPISLQPSEIAALQDAAKMDWSHIEPSIFGTLFERGLDPALRSQLGAQFTDPATIRKIVEPVVVAPLHAEWEEAKALIADDMVKYHAGGKGSQTALKAAQARFYGYIERLKNYRVLDAACGSGNFLYLALRALKDLEHRANLDAESLGLHRQLTIECGPDNVLGIEINPYAAELARVTVWIGEIQWMIAHGYDIHRNPILSPLDHVECRDAVLNLNGTEPDWPKADAVIGNPPFLGDKKQRKQLGAKYVTALRARYDGRIPGGADLVCYWFEKARAAIASGEIKAAGLVATNSIRGGANRKVLERIVGDQAIFSAWSDEEWVNDGAQVRVSLICWSAAVPAAIQLDGKPATRVLADLSDAGGGAIALDLSTAKPLAENAGVAFSGITKKGAFDVSRSDALALLAAAGNPNGRPNADVMVRWTNGDGVIDRDPEKWLINFHELREPEAARYEAPFQRVLTSVKPKRMATGSPAEKREWWKLARRAPSLFDAIKGLPRFIVTLETAKHRVFRWMHAGIVPDKNLVVIARDDDATFGILQSRFHVCWSLRLGTSFEDRPRYTSSTTFRTYPFPEGLTPDLDPKHFTNKYADAVAAAARTLNELRENWLNPPEWSDRVPDILPNLPDRVVAKSGFEKQLAGRTLTGLYNLRPAWLIQAHVFLDNAVATAYGWNDYSATTPDEAILARLLQLNASRA